MSDVLDLRHRLPRIWARVEALEIPSFRARRIAQATTGLSKAAAAHVDAELAPVAGSCGTRRIDRAIAEAKASVDPESVADAEEQAKACWGVSLSHGPVDGPGAWAGTSWLEAAGDTLDLTRFHDLVCEVAEQLRLDGDDSPLEIRKARALGVIADRHHGLDPRRGRGDGGRTRLYLHVNVADLDTPGALGTAERLGPVTLAKIRHWLQHSRATIVPVLDPGARRSLDRHDPTSGCASRWSCATVTVSSPGARPTPGPATSTTSSPTGTPTTAVHPARRIPRTWRRCAGDITAARPPGTSATAATPTGATPGGSRWAAATWSAAWGQSASRERALVMRDRLRNRYRPDGH